MSNKTIRVPPSADPADMILYALVSAGSHRGIYRPGTVTEYDHEGKTVVEAVSTLWRRCAGALSTGPLEYSRYALDRAEARRQLPDILRKHLADVTVFLPSSRSARTVRWWLRRAGVRCFITTGTGLKTGTMAKEVVQAPASEAVDDPHEKGLRERIFGEDVNVLEEQDVVFDHLRSLTLVNGDVSHVLWRLGREWEQGNPSRLGEDGPRIGTLYLLQRASRIYLSFIPRHYRALLPYLKDRPSVTTLELHQMEGLFGKGFRVFLEQPVHYDDVVSLVRAQGAVSVYLQDVRGMTASIEGRGLSSHTPIGYLYAATSPTDVLHIILLPTAIVPPRSVLQTPTGPGTTIGTPSTGPTPA